MHYALLDSGGNLIDAFDVEDEARAALVEIVRSEPEAADHVALITYDDAGTAVGPAITIPAEGPVSA